MMSIPYVISNKPAENKQNHNSTSKRKSKTQAAAQHNFSTRDTHSTNMRLPAASRTTSKRKNKTETSRQYNSVTRDTQAAKPIEDIYSVHATEAETIGSPKPTINSGKVRGLARSQFMPQMKRECSAIKDHPITMLEHRLMEELGNSKRIDESADEIEAALKVLNEIEGSYTCEFAHDRIEEALNVLNKALEDGVEIDVERIEAILDAFNKSLHEALDNSLKAIDEKIEDVLDEEIKDALKERIGRKEVKAGQLAETPKELKRLGKLAIAEGNLGLAMQTALKMRLCRPIPMFFDADILLKKCIEEYLKMGSAAKALEAALHIKLNFLKEKALKLVGQKAHKECNFALLEFTAENMLIPSRADALLQACVIEHLTKGDLQRALNAAMKIRCLDSRNKAFRDIQQNAVAKTNLFIAQQPSKE